MSEEEYARWWASHVHYMATGAALLPRPRYAADHTDAEITSSSIDEQDT